MLPVYRTILVACDLSDSASQPFRHALNLARSQEGRIHALHVLPGLGSEAITYVSNLIGKERFNALEISHEREAVELLREEMNRFIERELQTCTEDWCRIAELEVHRGNPVAEIIKAAERLQADIIVLGSFGKGSLKHAFLGSVADQVLEKSSRPILIVPIDPDKYWTNGESSEPNHVNKS